MPIQPGEADRKPFLQGWKSLSRLLAVPRPLNEVYSEEFMLSDGLALFVRHEEIAPRGGAWGWRNSASEFRTLDSRRTSGYNYLFWDVLLLAEHPGEIVETHRGDEDFYHSLEWEEGAHTCWIKQWGSQERGDIRLSREEFEYIIGEIRRAPEGTPYTEDKVDYKGDPTICHHTPRPSDRPDWCDDCEHPWASCECLCWHCGRPARQRSCAVCR